MTCNPWSRWDGGWDEPARRSTLSHNAEPPRAANRSSKGRRYAFPIGYCSQVARYSTVRGPNASHSSRVRLRPATSQTTTVQGVGVEVPDRQSILTGNCEMRARPACTRLGSGGTATHDRSARRSRCRRPRRCSGRSRRVADWTSRSPGRTCRPPVPAQPRDARRAQYRAANA